MVTRHNRLTGLDMAGMVFGLSEIALLFVTIWQLFAAVFSDGSIAALLISALAFLVFKAIADHIVRAQHRNPFPG